MTKNTDNLANIEFIQYLNRMVLEEAERAITEPLPSDQFAPKIKNDDNTVETPSVEEQEAVKMSRMTRKKWGRMWGFKNPIVWMLEKIADTELKIAKYRPDVTGSPQLSQREEELFNSMRGEENP